MKKNETMYINSDGEVNSKNYWLWLIGNDVMRNGTPEEVFERCVAKQLLIPVK